MLTEQARARHAAERIAALPRDKKTIRDYTTRVQGMPASIQRMGLAAVLADCRAAKSGQNGRVGRDIEAWLIDPSAPIGWTSDGDQNIDERLATCSTAVYYQAALEAVRYCVWLKRLSRARANTP